MGVALDTATTPGPNSGTSLTWSHTCTGADGLFVFGYSPNNVSFTGATYAGAAMTQEASVPNKIFLWKKVAPASGANNVAISSSSYTPIGGGASSWSGVDQTTPLTNTATNSGSGYGTPVTTGSITCPTNGAVLGGVHHDYSNLGINTGTELGNYHSGGGGWEYAHGYRTSTGEIKWNGANVHGFYIIGTAINPAAAAATLRPQALTILDAVHRASNW